MIRGKTKNCPFGLSVPGGCMSAGGASTEDESPVVSKMVPVSYGNTEDQMYEIMSDNLEELLLAEAPAQCPFADRVFAERGSVDCKFDQQSDSMPAGNVSLNGSPNYPHLMVGNSPKAQYGYPVNQYSDDNENTSVYYGIYSLIG